MSRGGDETDTFNIGLHSRMARLPVVVYSTAGAAALAGHVFSLHQGGALALQKLVQHLTTAALGVFVGGMGIAIEFDALAVAPRDGPPPLPRTVPRGGTYT